MAQYSITELEKLTGIKAHTLRVWEKRHGICHPCRDEYNVRKYTEEDLQHLIKVSHLNQQGHKISSIASLSRKDLDALYRQTMKSGDSGCCIIDKLTLAVQKTQESKLYQLLQERLTTLGIQKFVSGIWEPMQERLGFLALSCAVHTIHLKLFDQIVERLLESENISIMLKNKVCHGSALLINTCGTSSAVFHHLTKRLLIENQLDVLSLCLCQKDWDSLESILANRRFHHVFIHYKSKEFSSPPPYRKLALWIPEDIPVVIYGSKIESDILPTNWVNREVSEVLNYVNQLHSYNQVSALYAS